jgi:NTP pyrophosphatase (non-canonical NTP hydrolase)
VVDNKLTFDSYQEQTNYTVVYDPDVAVLYPLIGLANEAGEVLGKYKKFLRGDKDIDDTWEGIASELGDVLWYIARVADDMGYSMSDIAQRNLHKLEDRKERAALKGDGDTR